MLEAILHICSKCNTPKDFSVMGHHLGNDVLVRNTVRIHECIIHITYGTDRVRMCIFFGF